MIIFYMSGSNMMLLSTLSSVFNMLLTLLSSASSYKGVISIPGFGIWPSSFILIVEPGVRHGVVCSRGHRTILWGIHGAICWCAWPRRKGAIIIQIRRVVIISWC